MPGHTDSPITISSVDYEEMAFAMALFDGAANGQVPPPTAVDIVFSSSEMRDARGDVSQELLSKALDISEQVSPGDVSLTFGLVMVWHHYQGDERQQIICSRLLAFYDLTAQRIEPIFGTSKRQANASTGAIFRDPSIIRIVACAPLNDHAGFDEACFRGAASERHRHSTGYPTITTGDHFPESPVTPSNSLSKSALHLAKLLYIYEACALSPSAHGELLNFLVLRRFCCAIAKISGNVAVKSLLTRALASTRSEFPWLSAARISAAGRIEGLKTFTLKFRPLQVMEGELALVGSLVQSLRCALGDDVTISLLRALWPLVSFPSDTTPITASLIKS